MEPQEAGTRGRCCRGFRSKDEAAERRPTGKRCSTSVETVSKRLTRPIHIAPFGPGGSSRVHHNCLPLFHEILRRLSAFFHRGCAFSVRLAYRTLQRQQRRAVLGERIV